jgi:hypothetical protein
MGSYGAGYGVSPYAGGCGVGGAFTGIILVLFILLIIITRACL